jgi:hypothetical protein
MGYLVLPITGLPFALVGLAPVQAQAGGWFWAEAAGAFTLGSTSLGLELCLLFPRQRLLNCAYLTRFVEDAQEKRLFCYVIVGFIMYVKQKTIANVYIIA